MLKIKHGCLNNKRRTKMSTCYICGKSPKEEEKGGFWSHKGFVPWSHDECIEIHRQKSKEEKIAYIQSLKDQGLCIFNLAWIGYCKKEVVPGTHFCEEHLGVKCKNPGCDNQAIAQCDATSVLVCGAPFCEQCGRHKACYD